MLVGVRLPKDPPGAIDRSLDELSRLAETAGAVCVSRIVQRRSTYDAGCYIGRGKAAELGASCRTQGIATVIFDDDLKPGQQKALEEIMDVKIIDRTRLILDIFARRARTREGILQVERAQLSYYLPRLSKQGVHLDSQVGGIGTRGPGERKLEVDARHVRKRIADLDRSIDAIRDHRAVARSARGESGIPTIAIVGYTNAGKSTLLNTLCGNATVYADDKLFATLDPTTRHVRLPGGRTVFFTDTVGFISKLPHTLVAAFRATLEEVSAAQCLVHVVDAAHPDWPAQAKTVHEVMATLDADRIPMITVYNKADLLAAPARRKIIADGDIVISARTGENISEMLRRIESCITPRLARHRVTVPYDKQSRLAAIRRLAIVQREQYVQRGIALDISSTAEHWRRIERLLG